MAAYEDFYFFVELAVPSASFFVCSKPLPSQHMERMAITKAHEIGSNGKPIRYLNMISLLLEPAKIKRVAVTSKYLKMYGEAFIRHDQ